MRKLDFSLGDPLLPLTYVANYAFRKAGQDLNHYQMVGQTNAFQHKIGKLLVPLSDYFSSRGIFVDGHSAPGTRGILVTGGGTTEAFEQIMRVLAADVRKRNEKYKQKLKPVILMPSPAYGFFFNAAKAHGIQVVTVERDLKNNGKFNREKLIEAVRQVQKDGKRIVAFCDSNPNNPTGLVRGEEETRMIAEIIQGLNIIYEREDTACNKAHNNKWKFNGLISRVKIIDDMVYDGLEYRDSQKPFSFMQLRDERFDVSKDTIVLCGASKAGLAALRVGLMIGSSDVVDSVMVNMQLTAYFPPMTNYHAATAYFSDQKPFAKKREKHLQKLNDEHEIRGKLMKCLINGFENSPEVSAEDFEKLVHITVKAKGNTEKARSLLISGIRGINVITTPQSGFFHLIDFSGLKDKPYNDVYLQVAIGAMSKESAREYNENILDFRSQGLNNMSDVQRVASLSFAWAQWMGLDNDKDKWIVRATFAKPVSEILDLCGRLKKLSGFLHAAQPMIQPTQKTAPAYQFT